MANIKKAERSIENAQAIVEALSFAADGPHMIHGDMIDRVTRAVLDELARAQEALDAADATEAAEAEPLDEAA